ncbi:alpha/beta hydrolase [Streptomyces sp. HNM0575]|nr:alpha/beta hydrolase [Streptomyces sp. HNM0575]NLU73897.1 alpha/beta hydrolase [Streptomyces sp. HNM0575]
MSTTAPDTVVLIHGLWMTPLSWHDWVSYLEDRGYRVIAPTWPRMDRPIEELRAHPSLVGGLGVTEVTDHHAELISRLDTPPIVMGHSVGGLVTQLLLDRGLGAAGVAIHPGQTKGVFGLPPAQLRAALPAVGNPFNLNRGVPLTPAQFHWGFANALSEEDAREAWSNHHVPAPARPLFQAALANFTPRAATRVDYRKADRAPLLFVAGDADRTVPASVVKENHRRYKSGVTHYMEFPGRSHFTVGEKGWEEVVGRSLEWAVAHSAGARSGS